MTDGIELALKWAAKQRNEGAAHHAVHAELSDAWLMVHVVGALIVRLADDSLRGTPQPWLGTSGGRLYRLVPRGRFGGASSLQSALPSTHGSDH